MARIPENRFGQRGPDRVGPFNPDTRGMTAGLDGAAQAARVAGAAIQSIADTNNQIAARRRAEDESLARAKAANAALDDEQAVRFKASEIQQRMADGSLPWQQAEEEFQTWYSERQPPTIDGLAPDDAERFKGSLARNRFSGTEAIANLAQAGKRADFKGQIGGLRDKLGKLASDPNADLDKIVAQSAAMRGLAEQAGLGDTWDKDQQDFSDRVYSDNAKARLIASRDDMAGLQQLERDLTEQGGRYAGRLDADKTNAIMAQITTAKTRLEAKAQHDADKGEATAQRALDQFREQIATTVAAPIDTMNGWAEAVKAGTPEQKAEFRSLIQGEIELRQVLAQPPEQQQAYLQQKRAKQTREGATKTDQANLARLENAITKQQELMRDAPLEFYGNRTGRAVEPLDLSALMSGDVAAVASQISQRMVTLSTLRKQYGAAVGASPLLPQEASALAGAIAKATPGNALKLFGTMSQAFRDPAAYRAAMQQVSPDSPVRAYAGMIYAEQRSTTLQAGSLFRGAVNATSGDVAKTMLEGEALLNKSKGDKGEDGKGPAFPMPSNAEMADKLHELVKNAFAQRPGAYEVAMQAVRAYYAGDAAKAGDVKGELDDNRFQRAVRAVLGDPVEVGGASVFPPWGMGEDDFRDKLEAAWDKAAGALPAGASRDLEDYTIVQRGNGAYYVTAAGAFLRDGQGRPLLLNVAR